MAIDPETPRSRRAVLGAALGGAAAIAAASLVRPPEVAAGTDGDMVLGVFQDAPGTTEVMSAGGDGFHAFAGGDGSADGLGGFSTTGVGVFGGSNNGESGTTHKGRIGVRGWAYHEVSPGVPDSTSIGVLGEAGPGTGVKGWSNSGTGIDATSATGAALSVHGKVKLSRSGRTSVSAGHSSRTITMAGVTTASYVIATLQTNRAGVHVQAVVPSSGKFTIFLNKAVSGTTYVGYLVVN
jgi:hypothetical protein